MTDVIVICVRSDLANAEALGGVLHAQGLSVGDANVRDYGAALILWSEAAAESGAFLRAARKAVASGDAMIASLCVCDASRDDDLPVFNISRWRGDPDDPTLEPLKKALRAKRQVRPGPVLAFVRELRAQHNAARAISA